MRNPFCTAKPAPVSRPTATMDRIALFNHFRDRFAVVMVQSERDARREIINTPTGPETGWVIFEREQALAMVNEARAVRGLGPIPMTDVEYAEGQAHGHSDYARKWAIGLADLVLDGPRPTHHD